MLRYLILGLLLVAAALTGQICCQPGCAWALPEELLREDQRLVDEKAQELRDQRELLESMPREEWSPVMLQRYFSTALWSVYYGTTLYLETNDRLPDSLAALAGTRFIPTWPANPCTAQWAPMAVKSPGDGFSAGDLVLQVCPAEFYSFTRSPRPMSFELGVYGPDKTFAELGSAQPLKSNSWAQVAGGTLLQAGFHMEPASVSRQKQAAAAAVAAGAVR